MVVGENSRVVLEAHLVVGHSLGAPVVEANWWEEQLMEEEVKLVVD